MAGEATLPSGTTAPRGLRLDEIRWPLVAARDLFALRYGKALVAGIRRTGRVPVFGTNGECGQHDTALFCGPGVILGRKGQGPLGVEWSSGDFWVIDTGYALDILSPDIELKYAYHLIKFIGLNHLKDGTSNPTLSRDAFGAQALPVPPLAEQHRIAHILGTLDDKIELNRRMSETLEAMARALFKSWFVDFDPVRAKAEGRDTGLPKHIADLFPDSFEESEIGEIPKGWKVRVLGDLSSLTLGGDWGDSEPADAGSVAVRCVRGADIPDLQRGSRGRMPLRFLQPSSLAKRSLRAGDIVVEISGGSPTQSTGRPVLVTDGLIERLDAPLAYSNFCRLVRLDEPSMAGLVYFWLRWLYSRGELIQFENGTTGIKNLAFSLFSKTYPVVVPDGSVVRAFDSWLSSLSSRRQLAAAESETLETLRNASLPRLISGSLLAKRSDSQFEQVES